MLLTFQNINIPIAAGKTQGPSQVLEFMGIILGSAKMQARLPAHKIKRLQDIFDQFYHRRSCSYIKGMTIPHRHFKLRI